MNWPLASDYQDAVQNPKQCFQDPQLQGGQVTLNRLGLPRVASGMFASVYEMRNGEHRWAVRCFLRPSADQRERYAALSAYLSQIKMPGMVGFAYEPQGIRVRGQWYPIVKMDWVEGVTLHTYISKHLEEPDTLRRLARQWRKLLADLRHNGIAHADLQHGNVLVTPNGELRLVDYDGLFVPSLRGQASHELGHPNYQHPQRAAESYNANLDNFAALVIYTSLVALIYDPRLWETFHTGENLLFSATDFKAPQKSDIFKRLYQSGEPLVRKLSQKLAEACEGVIWRVPDFAETVASLPDLPAPTPWWHDPPAPTAQPKSANAQAQREQAQSQPVNVGTQATNARTQAANTGGKPPTAGKTPTAAPAPPNGRSSPRPPVSAPPAPSAPAHAATVPGQQAPPAPEEDEGWWKPAQDTLQKTPAGKAALGFLQPLKRMWDEAGTPASVPAPSPPNTPPAHTPTTVPLERGVPRSTSKNRREPRWLTCTSVTLLFLCLALFGIGLLAKIAVRAVSSLLAEDKPAATVSATKTTNPAPESGL